MADEVIWPLSRAAECPQPRSPSPYPSLRVSQLQFHAGTPCMELQLRCPQTRGGARSFSALAACLVTVSAVSAQRQQCQQCDSKLLSACSLQCCAVRTYFDFETSLRTCTHGTYVICVLTFSEKLGGASRSPFTPIPRHLVWHRVDGRCISAITCRCLRTRRPWMFSAEQQGSGGARPTPGLGVSRPADALKFFAPT
eukprot:355252-Chlamydomonas_euryale.AAC.5